MTVRWSHGCCILEKTLYPETASGRGDSSDQDSQFALLKKFPLAPTRAGGKGRLEWDIYVISRCLGDGEFLENILTPCCPSPERYPWKR